MNSNKAIEKSKWMQDSLEEESDDHVVIKPKQRYVNKNDPRIFQTPEP